MPGNGASEIACLNTTALPSVILLENGVTVGENDNMTTVYCDSGCSLQVFVDFYERKNNNM